MHVLYAEFTALAGREATVRQLISEYALVVRREPGNVAFEVFEKTGLPGRFFVFEKYLDDDAFSQHLEGAEGRVFNAALEPHIEGGRSRLTTLDPIGPPETPTDL
jgi:quinol monooxygenase YgiN